MLTDALMKYAVFSGRARRSAFWGFVLLQLIVSFVAAFLDAAAGTIENGRMGIFLALTTLVFFIPAWAVTVRRLHDTNKSGWWSLIGVIPLIGGLALLVFMLLDSNPAENAYGPNPKSPSESCGTSPANRSTTPDMQARFSNWVLSGFDAQGNRLRFSIDMRDTHAGIQGWIIGRDPENADLAVASDSVSRRHARIFLSDGDLWIEDLNSTNGTELNGKRLDQGRAGVFTNGAKLSIGDIELMLTRMS